MRPSGWTGSDKVARSRPQRPLATPRRRQLGHAPPPPRPFGSVWRQCLRSLPTASCEVYQAPSTKADAVSECGCQPSGKEKRRNE